MHISFKIKKKRNRALSESDNQAFSKLNKSSQQKNDIPSNNKELMSFKQYCITHYKNNFNNMYNLYFPSTNSENPSRKDNSFVNTYIKNELDEWNDESMSKETGQAKSLSNKTAFITNLKVGEKNVINKSNDKNILPKEPGYLLGDLKIRQLNLDKKNKFKDYINDVIKDTSIIREKAQEIARQTFGEGNRWRKIDFAKSYFPKQQNTTLTELNIQNQQLQEQELRHIQNYGQGVLSDHNQANTSISFQKWIKKDLDSLKNRSSKSQGQKRSAFSKDQRDASIAGYRTMVGTASDEVRVEQPKRYVNSASNRTNYQRQPQTVIHKNRNKSVNQQTKRPQSEGLDFQQSLAYFMKKRK